MMKMVKNPVVFVACTLLLSALAVLASQGSFGPNQCCFMFISRSLPKNKVIDHKYTNKLCPMQGVLFTMLNNAVFCADPSVKWVQNIIEARDRVLAQRGNDSLSD